MLDRLEFFFTEAFTALKRNSWMTFAAVSTAAMALYLLGGLGIGFVRLNSWLSSLKKDYQVRVFLKDGLSPEAIQSAQKSIEVIPGVKRVAFVSKEAGLKEFASKNPNIDVSDMYADNPLPNVFHVTLTDLDLAPKVTEALKTKDFVERPNGVKSSDDLRASVEQIVRYSRMLGVAVAAIMFITGGVLIYNSIRLTIVARRREIRIMELVGATKSTVRIPLLIEGAFHGLMGGVLAYLLLYLSVDAAGRLLKTLDAFAAAPPTPGNGMFFLLFAAGGLYGLTCSALAARNPKVDAP